MLFNSQSFLFFSPIVFLIYGIIPKKGRKYWLLIASYYFYMNWNAKYGILLAFSTFITYLGAILLTTASKVKVKKWIVTGCIIANLAILGFFKYFDFLINSLNSLSRYMGGSFQVNALNILLPVGISFYIFQAVGYLIDVYRGDVDAERNIVTYALFVSFFPQLVAGPIERSRNLLSQIKHIEEIHVWKYGRIKNGAILIIWGLFLKMVIADRAAILVNQVFGEYYRYGTVELCIAAALFAIQIYCDFGGYSVIAQGVGMVIGIKLMDNFQAPYFSSSIKEFWNRWHISLSTWFRDYLYIPLGGSRCSVIKKYRNNFIVFLVSGLWHGAGWHYVLWGGVHGVYQIAGMALTPFKAKCNKLFGTKTEVFSYRLFRRVSTFILVDFAWIFFRADSLQHAWEYIKRIFAKWNPWILTDGGIFSMGLDGKELFVLIMGIIFLFVVDVLCFYRNERIEVWIQKQNIWFEWFVIWGLLFGVIIFGVYGLGLEGTQFVYFQF